MAADGALAGKEKLDERERDPHKNAIGAGGHLFLLGRCAAIAVSFITMSLVSIRT